MVFHLFHILGCRLNTGLFAPALHVFVSAGFTVCFFAPAGVHVRFWLFGLFYWPILSRGFYSAFDHITWRSYIVLSFEISEAF